MEDKKRVSKESPRNSILDYNLSWILLFVYLGFLLGIWFAQRSTINNYIISSFSGTAYFLTSIILGIVLTFVIYNTGKILFAKAAGYKIFLIKLLGMRFDFSTDKLIFSYHILDFFNLTLQFAPKDDDPNKKPGKIFYGGFIAEAILIVAVLILFFTLSFSEVKNTKSTIGWTALFAVFYGFLTPLYELLPFRQDYPTDMFNLLTTRKKEDKLAYNVYQINQKREISGENFLVQEFESYDSFYRSKCLLYVYLDNLYSSRLEKAFTNCSDMNYYKKYFSDYDRYIVGNEMIYLRYLIDDEQAADKTYLEMKKDDKKLVLNPEQLSDYRTAILASAYIANDKDKITEIANEFDAKIADYETSSTRIEKEKELFSSAYKKIQKAKPNFQLPDRY